MYCPLMNGWGLSVCPYCPTKPDGFNRNTCPFSWPRKNSVRIGPNHPRKLGSFKGVVRLMRNMFMGWMLSLKSSGPPSPGPHHRLCLPNVNSQFDNINPTYASKSLRSLTAGCGVPGASSGKKLICVWTASRVASEYAGTLGAVSNSPRTYATQGPLVPYAEKPLTELQPSPYGRPKSLNCV